MAYDLRTYVNKTRAAATVEVDRVDAARVRLKFKIGATTAVSLVCDNADADSLVREVSALLAAPVPPPEPTPEPTPPPAPSGSITLAARVGSFGGTTTLSARGATYERIGYKGLVHVTGDNITLNECQILGWGGDAPVSAPDVQLWWSGLGGKLIRSQVADNQWHAGIYVDGEVEIEGCHIKDNGGRDTNRSHGVYWDKGKGSLRRSLIEGSMAFGAQIYPGPVGPVIIEHNHFRNNGNAGVLLGSNAHDVQVFDNLFEGNNGAAVTSYQLTGANNIARDNFAFGNARNIYEGTGYAKGVLGGTPPAAWVKPQPLTFV